MIRHFITETVLWLCICDRHASVVILSVGHALDQDCHSVLRVFTLNKMDAVLPSARQTTMSIHNTALVVGCANASAVVLAVCRVLDLQLVIASLV